MSTDQASSLMTGGTWIVVPGMHTQNGSDGRRRSEISPDIRTDCCLVSYLPNLDQPVLYEPVLDSTDGHRLGASVFATSRKTPSFLLYR